MDFDVRGSKGHVMTTFDKREEVFENKFAHDEELRFKAHARRNKLVGLWAAGKLGLAGEAAEAYAKAVVTADLDAPEATACSRRCGRISMPRASPSRTIRSAAPWRKPWPKP